MSAPSEAGRRALHHDDIIALAKAWRDRGKLPDDAQLAAACILESAAHTWDTDMVHLFAGSDEPPPTLANAQWEREVDRAVSADSIGHYRATTVRSGTRVTQPTVGVLSRLLGVVQWHLSTAPISAGTASFLHYPTKLAPGSVQPDPKQLEAWPGPATGSSPHDTATRLAAWSALTDDLPAPPAGWVGALLLGRAVAANPDLAGSVRALSDWAAGAETSLASLRRYLGHSSAFTPGRNGHLGEDVPADVMQRLLAGASLSLAVVDTSHGYPPV